MFRSEFWCVLSSSGFYPWWVDVLYGESINEYKKMGLLEPDIIETTIEELKKRLIEDFKEELSSYDFDDIASARNSHLEYLYESRYD